MVTVLPPHGPFTCRNPRHIAFYSLVPRTHYLWNPAIRMGIVTFSFLEVIHYQSLGEMGF